MAEGFCKPEVAEFPKSQAKLVAPVVRFVNNTFNGGQMARVSLMVKEAFGFDTVTKLTFIIVSLHPLGSVTRSVMV